MATRMGSQGGLFGSLEPYDGVSAFADYKERLDFFFEANGVETCNEKKRAILLTSIGPKNFSLIKDLCHPGTPRDKTYDEICQMLSTHFNPKPPKFLQRKKFESRVRNDGESLQDFIASLRSLTEHCDFGEQIEDRLCERFILGVNSEQVQRRLLTEEDLTLDKAVKIAQSIFESNEGAREISNPCSSSTGLNALFRRQTNISGPGLSPSTSVQVQSSSRPIQSETRSRSKTTSCHGCGGNHLRSQCRFRQSKCFSCGTVGHIARVCKSEPDPPRNRRQNTYLQNYRSTNSLSSQENRQHMLETSDPALSTEAEFHNGEFNQLFTISERKPAPYNVEMFINSVRTVFQIDTGASLTVTPKDFYDRKLKFPLKTSRKQLRTYTGQQLKIHGECEVKVNYNGQKLTLPLLVVDGSGPPLLGRNWLQVLHLDWHEIFAMEQNLDTVLDEHKKVFKEELGCLTDFKASINIDRNTLPKFCRARTVPFSLRNRVEEELNRLEKDNVIEKVEYSEWATPIVPVIKPSGQIRICGDFKTTVNQAAKSEIHPLPTKDEILYKLSGGKFFTELDLSNAYNQIQLDEESKKYTTINTHKGLYRYNRLVFGISSAPGIFQRTIECILKEVKNCACYLDNIYISGKTKTEHLATLTQVLNILGDKGLRLRKEKCQFMKESINFLGYKLCSEGVKPLCNKIEAIQQAPAPKNVTQLRSYLGLINYYSSFTENLSAKLHPLYDLLEKHKRWNWTKVHQDCFEQSKHLLTSENLLVHYNPSKPIVISCDASPYGIGCVMSHIMEDGKERPISYASRTLSAAEKNYAQIDREGLAIIFAVTKFHKFIFGRPVTIYTDHRPLLGLFGENKLIPTLASPRIIRWAVTLSGYNYTLRYRPGKSNGNSDGLSRLPMKDEYSPDIPQDIQELFSSFDRSNSPVTSHDIAQATSSDPILKEVLLCVKNNNRWNSSKLQESAFKQFFHRKDEFSVENNCLMWGHRLVIPFILQSRILEILHDTHLGMVRMKSLARSWVWWPKIDKDIEKCVQSCEKCQQFQNSPAKAPLHPMEWPEEPWERLHLDFAGPFLGKMFLVLFDAHSKWIDVKIMSTITACNTIFCLRQIFANFGLPKVIMTDNGTTFKSIEFQNFLFHNGVKHFTSSPFQPSSNGAAERAVQTFKNALKKMQSGTLEERVLRFLTRYRITPHSTTGLTPSELMLGRRFRTHLDLLHPGVHEIIQGCQRRQKKNHDRYAKDRNDLEVNDRVMVRDYTKQNPKWVPGIVRRQTGPLSYRVDTDTQGQIRRHRDQIRKKYAPNPNVDVNPNTANKLYTYTGSQLHEPMQIPLGPNNDSVLNKRGGNSEIGPDCADRCSSTTSSGTRHTPEFGNGIIRDSTGILRAPTELENGVEVRKSERIRKPPNRFSDEFNF